MKAQRDNWQILASYFERDGVPVSEIELTVQIHGVYSIPEEWLKLEACGAVDLWYYQTRVSDILFLDGKLNQRELTEDEKREIENKKKKPDAGNKKKTDEQIKEENEKLEKERLEREEKERKFLEEWNALDEMTKFYKTKENPTKEPWISFPQGKNILSIKKSGYDLIELDDDINTNEGFTLEFAKVPPPDEDIKKRPKPKNINPEDVKPFYCISWLDLSEFKNKPGLTEITLRSPLMLKETYEKKTNIEEENEEKPDNNHMDKSQHNSNFNSSKIINSENNKDYVQLKESYIFVTISFSSPMNPIIPDNLPSPLMMIKREEKPFKKITAEEICQDYRKQLKIAIEAICKDYINFLGDNKNQLIKKEKNSSRLDDKIETYNKYMIYFNQTGKAELLKEKLKKFIVLIIREKYGKKNSLRGVFKDNRDAFFSELYAYLSDEVKIAMDEYVALKREELHDNIFTSYDQSRREVYAYASKVNKEPEEKRLLRLSMENETIDELPKAFEFYKCRLTLIDNKETWTYFASMAKSLGMIIDYEEAIIRCIELDQNDLNLKIIFAGIKWLKNRLNDSINYMNNIINSQNIKNTSAIFNIFLAFLYKENGKDLLYIKHVETAKRFKMRELNMIPPVGQKKKIKDVKKPVLPDEKFDEIVFTLIALLNDYNLIEASDKLLEFIINKDSIKYYLAKSKILLIKHEYDAVIQITNNIVDKDKSNYNAWILRGSAFYYKNNIFDSEESFIKAIRFKPEKKETYDVKMLFKLGTIYLKRKTWGDAKTVFSQILKIEPGFAFAWRYLGLAYLRLGEYESAEEALNEANLLDIENSELWAYITILCLRTGRKNQALECLNELEKCNYTNVEILEEIGDLFFEAGEFELTAEIYNKILNINPKNINVHINLADIYYHRIKSRKNESIEVLKNSLKYTNDENDKKRIAGLIDNFTKEIGGGEVDISNFEDKLKDASVVSDFNQVEGFI